MFLRCVSRCRRRGTVLRRRRARCPGTGGLGNLVFYLSGARVQLLAPIPVCCYARFKERSRVPLALTRRRRALVRRAKIGRPPRRKPRGKKEEGGGDHPAPTHTSTMAVADPEDAEEAVVDNGCGWTRGHWCGSSSMVSRKRVPELEAARALGAFIRRKSPGKSSRFAQEFQCVWKHGCRPGAL